MKTAATTTVTILLALTASTSTSGFSLTTPSLTVRRQTRPLFSSPEQTAAEGTASNNNDNQQQLSLASSLSPSTQPDTFFSAPVVVNGAHSKESTFPRFQSLNNILGRLRQVSNIASFLCVLDCTLLPIITVALPLLGVLQLPATQLAALNQLGHSLALYFVLPVGTLTTAVNFSSHRIKWIAGLACLGMVLVGSANAHIHHLPLMVASILPTTWTTAVEHGLHLIQNCNGSGVGSGGFPWHRITNVSGCALLLASNYLSQKQGCAHHHGDHDHDHHGHAESSSPSSSSSSCGSF